MIKKRLVGLLSHAKKYIVYQVVWQWLALLCQILLIFCGTALLAEGLSAKVTLRMAAVYGSLILLAILLKVCCERGASRASCRASMDVKRILRDKIYTKLLKLGASYREQVSTSEVVQLSGEGVEQLETYFGKYLPQLFYSLLAPLTLFAALSFVCLPASLALLICVPLIPLSIAAVQKIAKRLLSKYWGIYTELGDSFLENIQGLTTLKIYQADQQKAREMDAESQRFRRITMKVLTMQLNSTTVMDIVAYGGAAVGMILALGQFMAGSLSFRGTLMILLLAAEFFLPLRLLGSFFHIAMNGMAASDKIFALLDLPEPEQGTEEIREERPDIRIQDLRFSYEKDREILHGVDLDFPSGSLTALVGVSGCGKSTIAGLLAGTPLSNSATSAPLDEVEGVTAVADPDAAVAAGKLILVHDGRKVKLSRAVNSLVTVPTDQSEALKKIKIVEAVDLIRRESKILIEDQYVGQGNSYDNKMVLVAALQDFLTTLEAEGVILSGSGYAELNLEKQRAWLKSQGVDVANMTDTEILKADTGSYVWLKMGGTILDGMEDFDLEFYMGNTVGGSAA